MVTGPKFNESRILPPNEPVLISNSRFQVQAPGSERCEFPSIVAPPGKYRYSTGLHVGGTNNSNTDFAVMALFEAEHVGIKAAPETWRRVLDYWVRTQTGTARGPHY
jgi:hypothetical protein